MWLDRPHLGRPTEERGAGSVAFETPRDCREGGRTYRAPLNAVLCSRCGDGPVQEVECSLGQLPIMVQSSACNLRGLSQEKLLKRREDAHELGGYFVCNGNERLVRLLIAQRRHFPVALVRPSFEKRGSGFTEFGSFMRCCRPDQTAVVMKLHYLDTGDVHVGFAARKREYFLPVGIVLRCLTEASERETFEALVGCAEDGSFPFFADRAEIILRAATGKGLRSREAALSHVGSHFRGIFDAPESCSDAEAGILFLDRYFFVHLSEEGAKRDILIFMVQKLLALVAGRTRSDNVDSSAQHELLLPGQLIAHIVRDTLEGYLGGMRDYLRGRVTREPELVDLADPHLVKEAMDKKRAAADVGSKVAYFLNTGNFSALGDSDLGQTTGFSVMAERLSYHRYLAHFRSVHRGAAMAKMRTTKVRKLLPESWGFLCPVHTPDGAPCGLLLHLTHACRVVARDPEDLPAVHAALGAIIGALGLDPLSATGRPPKLPGHLPCLLDGRVVGHVRAPAAPAVVAALRALKAAALAGRSAELSGVLAGLGEHAREAAGLVPAHLEIVHVPYVRGSNHCGLFLFTSSARMVREVLQLPPAGPTASGEAPPLPRPRQCELIGTMEQVYLDIQCPDGTEGGTREAFRPTHRELGPGRIFSLLASLTPWCEYNQSPRNMYQCQMAKQTMGTPCHALPHKSDNKLYRLHYPQSPLSRTETYREYQMDEYPSGTNAVVAVISYTGFDMEDAMIINRASMDRGFKHGTMYKTEDLDLRDSRKVEFGVAELEPGARHQFAPKAKVGEFGERFPRVVPPDGLVETLEEWERESPDQERARERIPRAGEYSAQDRVDRDGMPHVGTPVWPDETYACQRDRVTGRAKELKLGAVNSEIGIVDQVVAIGNSGSGSAKLDAGLRHSRLRWRFPRNPRIGDKFATRHGQKGILSKLWPDEDMPYVASSGLRPDILFNPHGFPSRMTVGMWLEFLASKSAAVNGTFQDCTAFQAAGREGAAGDGGLGEGGDAVAGFGEELERRGFSRRGTETMVNGLTGEEIEVDIFVGVVYYQRLRHMVSDKFQVRSTGPVNPLHMQPVKGRKIGGGIRFGEMERDALLAYGCSYVLHDRLHRSSDYHVHDVCTGCGSMLSAHVHPRNDVSSATARGAAARNSGLMECRVCGHGRWVKKLAMPYVFKYLSSELAAMNVKVMLDIQPVDNRL